MENHSQNNLCLSGKIVSDIEFSHESHGRNFYSFKIETQRLSGTCDIINALISEQLLEQNMISENDFISAQCELRSFNKKTDTGNKLIISAFIKELTFADYQLYENELYLTGTICKPPVYRKTPLGREICDIMLAINRRYGRSDYLPLIAWGRNARIAEGFTTGDVISIRGRVQSRDYTKIIDGDETIKTTYEVSVSSITAFEYE